MNNNDDIPSMPSEPTMVGGANVGAGRPAEPHDEPSLGSAPTMVPGRAGDALGRIDQYDLVRKLGGGGFGVVYLARDTVSGIDVALKTLHPLLKTNAEEMEALRAKFALVSRLSHPNIASALVLHPCQRVDVWDESVRRELRLVPGDFIMVMRYAPGVTLSKWRRQFPDGVVPLDQALEVVRQVASALDYAHGERIVHRDIKPANVMVETITSSDRQIVKSSDRQIVGSSDRQGAGTADDGTKGPLDGATRIRVRILDFGLAAEIRSSMSRVSTETGDTSGTRPYMAPEQWLGRKQDGRTDQYALACVLYELLSSAPPFAGVFETGDPVIMERAVTAREPEEIEGVSPAVNAALLKALAKNPKERFASCAEFVAALWKHSKRNKKLDFKVKFGNVRENVCCIDRSRQTEEQHGDTAPILISRENELKPGTIRSVKIASDVTMEFCWCPATTSIAWKQISGGEDYFRMGLNAKIVKLTHGDLAILGLPVKLTRGFWMGRTPVTQEQWLSVMGYNPSKCLHGKNLFGFGGKTSPRRPVDSVSWNDCEGFIEMCRKKTDIRFSLPTEAQFEYAALAGDQSKSSFSRLIYHDRELKGILKEHYSLLDPFCSNSIDDCGDNNWKIVACHGYGCVWQWCSNWKAGSRERGECLQDPIGPSSGDYKVLKGGAIPCTSIVPHFMLTEQGIGDRPYKADAAVSCSNRYWADPDFHNSAVGFRICFQD